MKRIDSWILLGMLLPLAMLLNGQSVIWQTLREGQGGRPSSAVVNADRTVTFRLNAPNASKVSLYGDFSGGLKETNVPMVKDAQGVWSVTVGPLEPDVWLYFFLVDGMKVMDDSSVHVGFDGGHFNEFVIPGPASKNFYVNDVPHGTISQIWYPAPSIEQNARRAVVYTPPGYENGTTRYPVLYLVDNDELVWMKRGRADIILDNLIASGQAKPMIVVMANARYKDPAAGEYLDVELPSTKDRLGAWRGPGAQQQPPQQAPQAAQAPGRAGLYQGGGGGGLDEYGLRTGQSVARDLVPFIDKAYRTAADRDHRAICGASSPGAEAFYGGMTNLKTFAWIGLISGGLPTLPNVSEWIDMPPNASNFFRGPDLIRTIDPQKVAKLMPDMNANADLRLLWFSVGANDALANTQRKMTKLLDEKGVRYLAFEIPNQHHDWRSFRWSLQDFVPRLFQSAAQAPAAAKK